MSECMSDSPTYYLSINQQVGLSCFKWWGGEIRTALLAFIYELLCQAIAVYIVLLGRCQFSVRVFVLVAFDMLISVGYARALFGLVRYGEVEVSIVVGGIVWAGLLTFLHKRKVLDHSIIITVTCHSCRWYRLFITGDIVSYKSEGCQ